MTATGSLSIDVDDDTPTVAFEPGRSQRDDDARCGGKPGTGCDGGVDPMAANPRGTLAHSYGADGAGTTLLPGPRACRPGGGAIIQALSGGRHDG